MSTWTPAPAAETPCGDEPGPGWPGREQAQCADHRTNRFRQVLAGCALAQYACRRGHSAFYQGVPRLGEEVRIRHGNGTFGKWLIQLAKTDMLLFDDWGMVGIDSQTRADMLEIIDDRAANKTTIITSQLPIEHWRAWVEDAIIADVILDRIRHKESPFHPGERVSPSEVQIKQKGDQS